MIGRTLHDRVSRMLRAAGIVLQKLWGQVRAIYAAPFHLDPAFLPTHTLAQLEQKRRIDFLRVMILSFLCVEMLIVLISLFFSPVPINLRVTEAGEMSLGIICLTLSYQPYDAIAGYLYMLGSLGMAIFLAWSDPAGLNQRSILIYSLIVLIIIASGLVLPPQVIWRTTFLIAAIAIVSVLIEPIRGPVPPSIRYPHVIAAFMLFFLYAVAAILTQLYLRSTRVSLSVLSMAYANERMLEAMAEEFIDVASHELRAPLSPILLISRLIERRSSQPERQSEMPQLVGELASHVKRMDSLIDVLLDSTRVHAGTFSIDPVNSDVAQIIKEAVAAQRMHRQRDVSLSGVEQPIWGMVDPQRFWQLVTNLVGNALKYSLKDTPAEVRVHVIEDETLQVSRLRLSVCDHGPGISPQQQAHLFERFYRGGESEQISSTHRVEGFGLGLYVCHAIVAAHDGMLRVESVMGEGSVFIAEIPLSGQRFPASDERSERTARELA